MPNFEKDQPLTIRINPPKQDQAFSKILQLRTHLAPPPTFVRAFFSDTLFKKNRENEWKHPTREGWSVKHAFPLRLLRARVCVAMFEPAAATEKMLKAENEINKR